MSRWKPEPHKYFHSCLKCLLDYKVTYRTHLQFTLSKEPLCWKWRDCTENFFGTRGPLFTDIPLAALVSGVIWPWELPLDGCEFSLWKGSDLPPSQPHWKRYQECFWSDQSFATSPHPMVWPGFFVLSLRYFQPLWSCHAVFAHSLQRRVM